MAVPASLIVLAKGAPVRVTTGSPNGVSPNNRATLLGQDFYPAVVGKVKSRRAQRWRESGAMLRGTADANTTTRIAIEQHSYGFKISIRISRLGVMPRQKLLIRHSL